MSETRKVIVNGEEFEVELEQDGEGKASAEAVKRPQELLAIYDWAQKLWAKVDQEICTSWCARSFERPLTTDKTVKSEVVGSDSCL